MPRRDRRASFSARIPPSSSVSAVAVAAKAAGVHDDAGIEPSSAAIIAARPRNCAVLVSNGVRVSRSAISPREMTSVVM